jgi:hypothetical protein
MKDLNPAPHSSEGVQKGSARFAGAKELRDRLESIIDLTRSPMDQWVLNLKAYRRMSYDITPPDAEGSARVMDTNHGGLFNRLSQHVDSLTQILLSRPCYAAISPNPWEKLFARLDQHNRAFLSLEMSSGFTSVVKRKGALEKILRPALVDMLLTNGGFLMWSDDSSIVPSYIESDRVFPAFTASNNPENWDVVFIVKKVFWSEIREWAEKDDDSYNTSAINKFVEDCAELAYETCTLEWERLGVFDGQTDVSATDIVYAYYVEDDKVKIAAFPMDYERFDASNKSKREMDKDSLLFYAETSSSRISDYITLISDSSDNLYWGTVPKGTQMRMSSRAYELGLNKAFRGAVRSSTTFVSTNSPELVDRMRAGGLAEVEILGTDDKVQSFDLPVSAKSVVEIGEIMQGDSDRFNTSSLEGRQTQGGTPLSSREIQAITSTAGERDAIRAGVIIQGLTPLMEKSFNRVLEDEDLTAMLLSETSIDQIDGIDRNDIKPGLFSVRSVKGVHEPGVSLELSTLASSVPVGLADYHALSIRARAIVEPEFAMAFVKPLESASLHESQTLMLAGLENEIMDSPDLNPNNIPVLAAQNHVVHCGSHLSEIETNIANLSKLNEGAQQIIEAAFPVFVSDFEARVFAINTKMSHLEAHLVFLDRDNSLKAYTADVRRQLIPLRLAFENLERANAAHLEKLNELNADTAFLGNKRKIQLEMFRDKLMYEKALQDLDLAGRSQRDTLKADAIRDKADARNGIDHDGLIDKTSDGLESLDDDEISSVPSPEQLFNTQP